MKATMSVTEKLNYLRLEQDLSLESIAKKSKISLEEITDIFSGKRTPVPSVLSRLCKVLDTCCYDLFSANFGKKPVYLSKEENALIERYRLLNSVEKEKILRLIEAGDDRRE